MKPIAAPGTNTTGRKHTVKQYLVQLLEQMVADLDPAAGSGQVTVSAYDTAWAARVRCPEQPEQLAFPKSLDWLLNNQLPDGSWGSKIDTAYNLLPTMAALLALINAPSVKDEIIVATDQATIFLRDKLQKWNVGQYESSGFEVIAPMLLGELEKAGFEFQFEAKTTLLKLYDKKLRLANPELIYNERSSLLYSLEAFASTLDFERLKSQQSTNGGYGCSPAATAAVLIYGKAWDKEAFDWLQQLYWRNQSGAMPTAYPIDIFEVSWVLYNVLQNFDADATDFSPELINTLTKWILESFSLNGVSMSRFIGFPPDVDDTGMALAALRLAKPDLNLPIDSLYKFEGDSYFVCYQGERVHSISANAHALAGLLDSSSLLHNSHQQEVINKILSFLLTQRNQEGYWQDKWHLSPYYATCSVVAPMSKCLTPASLEALKAIVSWVLSTQSKTDGSWSSFTGLPVQLRIEETAYAIQILKSLAHIVPSVPTDQAIESGRNYLWQEFALHNYKIENWLEGQPQLWRAKDLYTPLRVVKAALLTSML